MKKKTKVIILIILILFSGGYLIINHHTLFHKEHAAEEKQLWTCPMHPQIVQDKPGNCPICGMKLVPLKKEEKPETAVRVKKIIKYKSTMMPGEISDRPGKDSMGMDMVPFEVREGRDEDINTPSGLAPVSITKEKRGMIGISFEKISRRNIFRDIRTSVRIVPDETRQFKVTTKVSGWVDKLYVNQTGQFTAKGSPLMSIYSPELLSAEQEYLSAIKMKDKLPANDPSMSASMGEIEKSARDRLSLYDISDEQIEKIKKTGTVERVVTLYSPASGYVSEKTVLAGQKIMMNDTLMVIIDLSHLWGEIDVYEADLPYIKMGMPVEITLPYWEGKLFRGRISFLNPFMDPETRTLKARVEIANTGQVLKPNMFGDAKLSYNIGKRPAVPESAVMRTGVQNYVFIEGKDDLIVPYKIKTGTRSGDGYYEILSGLKEGERVVTSANFLVDSESSLKAAFKEASGGQK